MNANLFEINDNTSTNISQEQSYSHQNRSTQPNCATIPNSTLDTISQTSTTNFVAKRDFSTLSLENENSLSAIQSIDSIENESIISDSNESYIETCTQINTLIETMIPSIVHTETTFNRDSLMQRNQNQLYLYDFTDFCISVLKQMIHLPVDYGMIASIKLLKTMKDGNIANSNYKKLIEWHLDTMNMTTQSSCLNFQSLSQELL